MHIMKKLGRFFAASVLKISLLLFATSFALSGVIGSPEPIQDSLEKSGVYETLVPGLVEAANKDSEKGEDVPLDNPKIQAIIGNSFSPELLENSTDEFLDGIYGWLNNNTTEPEFNIDLGGARESFIQGLANYAEQRLLSLKPCTAAQTRKLANQEVDPFTVKCRPPMVVSEEKKKLINELEKSEFLRDEDVSAATLTKDNPDLFTDELKGLPDGYQFLKKLPLITTLTAIASTAILILLHDDRRRGFRQVGILVLVTGILLLLGTILFQVVYNRLASPESFKIDNTSLKNSVIDLIGRLFSTFNRSLMIVSAIYTATGGATLGVLAYLNKKKGASEAGDKKDAKEENEEKPAEPTEKPD